GKPFVPLLRKSQTLRPVAAMLDLAPRNLPETPRVAALSAAKGEKRGRVAILNGCAQPVLNPGINAATLRLLNRFGIEVVTPKGEGCCGSLVHHMGREEQALEQARHNVD
ncbi:glycolate oxidase, partial [Bacillus safensis]|nr:glycolate oxidase [Bacillus safensis]